MPHVFNVANGVLFVGLVFTKAFENLTRQTTGNPPQKGLSEVSRRLRAAFGNLWAVFRLSSLGTHGVQCPSTHISHTCSQATAIVSQAHLASYQSDNSVAVDACFVTMGRIGWCSHGRSECASDNVLRLRQSVRRCSQEGEISSLGPPYPASREQGLPVAVRSTTPRDRRGFARRVESISALVGD